MKIDVGLRCAGHSPKTRTLLAPSDADKFVPRRAVDDDDDNSAQAVAGTAAMPTSQTEDTADHNHKKEDLFKDQEDSNKDAEEPKAKESVCNEPRRGCSVSPSQ